MEITPIYKRVIGLDVHQAKISACALIEQADGTVRVEHREFGAFKRDRRALALWAKGHCPEVVVMEKYGYLLEESVCRTGERRYRRMGGQCPSCQECSRAQDRCR